MPSANAVWNVKFFGYLDTAIMICEMGSCIIWNQRLN